MNIILILSSVLLNCAAQLCMRQGMLEIGEIDVAKLFTYALVLICNLWLWLAMVCYVVSILLWIVVLSRVEVSYAYPFSSIGYVVAAIAGYMLFHEHLTLIRISGILVICLGVVLIARS